MRRTARLIHNIEGRYSPGHYPGLRAPLHGTDHVRCVKSGFGRTNGLAEAVLDRMEEKRNHHAQTDFDLAVKDMGGSKDRRKRGR